MIYPKEPYIVGTGKGILHSNRAFDKPIHVTPDLPCNIIVIHGVNDVGTSYNALEKGLCQGLDARLHHDFTPGTYRMPVADDQNKVEADPDAVFYKRHMDDETHSPVIPFYWGFREDGQRTGTINGQPVDDRPELSHLG
jgi:hypothetical protein